MLTGFEKFEVSPGVASMTVSSYGIGFSKSAVIRMGKSEFVAAYVDYSGKRFAIQKCDEDEEGSTKFYHGQKNTSVRWNNKELIKAICKTMAWDVSSFSYKVEGEFSPEDNALIFELKTAEAVPKEVTKGEES